MWPDLETVWYSNADVHELQIFNTIHEVQYSPLLTWWGLENGAGSA